jgi:hypothetical protein
MAINVSGPAFRFTIEKAAAASGVLCAVAARLTRQLGGEPYGVWHKDAESARDPGGDDVSEALTK